MGKQLYVALLLSLFCCLPVFGEEAFKEETFPVQENISYWTESSPVSKEHEFTSAQKDIEQRKELSSFEQDKQGPTPNIRKNEEILCAGISALEEIASAVTVKKEEEASSISFTQEVLSVSVGQSYTELKETAKTLAAQAPPPSKQPKNRWGISLTPTEFDLLTRIVMLEAGGESALGQQAVTEVILNRMVSPYYGGSLEYVLSAKGQFTTWKKRYSTQAVPTPQVIASVNAVLQGETNILPFQTLYFSRKPQNRRIQIQIGRHTFCNQ